jgi:hypothetical protein
MGATTNYLWDEFSTYGDVVRENDAAGVEQVHYTLAAGMLISQTTCAGTSYFLNDALGSTRALTDSSGTTSPSIPIMRILPCCLTCNFVSMLSALALANVLPGNLCSCPHMSN